MPYLKGNGPFWEPAAKLAKPCLIRARKTSRRGAIDKDALIDQDRNVDPRSPIPERDDDAPSPRLRAVLPPELEGLPDEPSVPLDLDAFEHWAKTGEGEPWNPGL